MDPLVMLCVASAVFIATHFVPSTPLRGLLVGSMGQKAYTGLYSLVALTLIIWMTWAYNRAPAELLWQGPRWLPAVVMPFSFILLACGLFARNPTIVFGEPMLKSADPARGMIRVTRHPVMWSFVLWAVSHLISRGNQKSLVYFGSFALLASLGTLLMDARKKKTLGEDWTRFAAVSSNIPFVAILQGRNKFNAAEIGWRNPAIGVALYAVFFWLHPMLFGARPW